MSWTNYDKSGRRLNTLDKNVLSLHRKIKAVTREYANCKHVNGRYSHYVVRLSSDQLIEPWVVVKCSKCHQTMQEYEDEGMEYAV